MLATSVGVAHDDGLFEVKGVSVDGRRNRDFLPGSDDFVRWETRLDVETADALVTEAAFVGVLSKMLEEAWNSGVRMVVAGDIEPRLPWSGGIDRLRDPEDGPRP